MSPSFFSSKFLQICIPFQCAIQEDDRLLQATDYKGYNFMDIAEEVPGRTNRQCRERYKRPAHVAPLTCASILLERLPWPDTTESMLMYEPAKRFEPEEFETHGPAFQKHRHIQVYGLPATLHDRFRECESPKRHGHTCWTDCDADAQLWITVFQ